MSAFFTVSNSVSKLLLLSQTAPEIVARFFSHCGCAVVLNVAAQLCVFWQPKLDLPSSLTFHATYELHNSTNKCNTTTFIHNMFITTI